MRQNIRDRMGTLVATIDTLPSGVQEIRDRMGRLLGAYDPKTNQTRDQMGSLVGTGNVLSSLIKL